MIIGWRIIILDDLINNLKCWLLSKFIWDKRVVDARKTEKLGNNLRTETGNE
jgi:hypothetical protein